MSLLSKLTDPFLSGAERARNKPFLVAAMASAALAAGAKGEVSLAKRHALDEALDTIDALKVFDVHTAVDLFDDFVEEIRTGPERGWAKALRAISAIADDRESAKLLIRISAAVARADGQVSGREIERIEKISAALGLPAPDLAAPAVRASDPKAPRPSVIVLGNQKGGTGKSTTAMHLAVALLKLGHRVGSIDLDGRQGTLTRYVANRGAFAKRTRRDIVMPLHRCVEPSDASDREDAMRIEKARLNAAFSGMTGCKYVVIDTPANTAHLCRLGHAEADILITPLNDSFLDIDVLAQIDRDRREVLEPSSYCKMVWQQNEHRVSSGRAPLDWIVMRNRLGQLDTRNNREMTGLLRQLAKRMNFRLEPGFSERVVFRELFYNGLTLLDSPVPPPDDRPNASRRHARQEVSDLLRALGIPELTAGAKAASRMAVHRV